jgi:hypothetical protein
VLAGLTFNSSTLYLDDKFESSNLDIRSMTNFIFGSKFYLNSTTVVTIDEPPLVTWSK